MSRKRKPAALVSVNSHRIRDNCQRLRDGDEPEPPVAVRTARTAPPSYPKGDLLIVDSEGREVGRIKYRPRRALACGARVYLELKYEPKVQEVTR